MLIGQVSVRGAIRPNFLVVLCLWFQTLLPCVELQAEDLLSANHRTVLERVKHIRSKKYIVEEIYRSFPVTFLGQSEKNAFLRSVFRNALHELSAEQFEALLLSTSSFEFSPLNPKGLFSSDTIDQPVDWRILLGVELDKIRSRLRARSFIETKVIPKIPMISASLTLLASIPKLLSVDGLTETIPELLFGYYGVRYAAENFWLEPLDDKRRVAVYESFQSVIGMVSEKSIGNNPFIVMNSALTVKLVSFIDSCFQPLVLRRDGQIDGSIVSELRNMISSLSRQLSHWNFESEELREHLRDFLKRVSQTLWKLSQIEAAQNTRTSFTATFESTEAETIESSQAPLTTDQRCESAMGPSKK